MKCLICEKRPAAETGFCRHCNQKMATEATARANDQPVHFIAYQGAVMGLYRNGGDTLKPRLLKRDVDHLPKYRTINLDRYCPGFTREQIKRFKAAILGMTRA